MFYVSNLVASICLFLIVLYLNPAIRKNGIEKAHGAMLNIER
jgi:hypothetical protein